MELQSQPGVGSPLAGVRPPPQESLPRSGILSLEQIKAIRSSNEYSEGPSAHSRPAPRPPARPAKQERTLLNVTPGAAGSSPTLSRSASSGSGSSASSEQGVLGRPNRTIRTQPKLSTSRTVQTQPKLSTSRTVLTQPKLLTSRTVQTQPKLSTSRTVLTQPKLSTSRTVLTQPKLSTSRTVLTQPKLSTNRTVQTQPKLSTNRTVLTQPKLSTNRTVLTQPKPSGLGPEVVKPVGGQPDETGGHRFVCERCGRCKCADCTAPRALPSCLACRGLCLCSAEALLDHATCMCAVKGLFYHCSNDDAGDSCADRPCSLSRSRRCSRFLCMGLMSAVLPCLLCYPPAKAGLAAAGRCYDRAQRPGCRCTNSNTVYCKLDDWSPQSLQKPS